VEEQLDHQKKEYIAHQAERKEQVARGEYLTLKWKNSLKKTWERQSIIRQKD